MQNIVDLCKQLDGAVHPQDAPVFERHGAHGFNLDYPPPADIGDIVDVPVIILDNNGGYDPIMTSRELLDKEACTIFRTALTSPAPLDTKARYVSSYYRSRNFTHLLASGEATLVNAVAYRSVDGNAPEVRALTRALPSAKGHREWLQNEVLSLADRGERFVVVHRISRWLDAVTPFRVHGHAMVSRSSISADLSQAELSAVAHFLKRRR